MNQIKIHQDGTIFFQDNALNADPLSVLGCKVVLDPIWTLRSFFQMLSAYPVFIALNGFIPEYLKEFRKCPQKNCRAAELDGLELQRTIEMIGFPGTPGLEMFMSLKGIYQGEACEIKSFWLDVLLDLPLRLGCLNHIVFGDAIDTFRFETIFNLFELIDGISWELSFHNMPATCRLPF